MIVCLAVFSSPLACFLLCFYQRPRVVLISAAVHNPSSISGKKIDVARATTRLASDSRRRCQCQNRKPRAERLSNQRLFPLGLHTYHVPLLHHHHPSFKNCLNSSMMNMSLTMSTTSSSRAFVPPLVFRLGQLQSLE